jgi:amidase
MWQLSATEVVDKLKTSEVSPLEMVDVAISRIQKIEPYINALPIQFFDEARDIAKQFKLPKNPSLGWLGGLPIVIKDYNDVAGQLTTYGSPIYANNRPKQDDLTVAPFEVMVQYPWQNQTFLNLQAVTLLIQFGV